MNVEYKDRDIFEHVKSVARDDELLENIDSIKQRLKTDDSDDSDYVHVIIYKNNDGKFNAMRIDDILEHDLVSGESSMISFSRTDDEDDEIIIEFILLAYIVDEKAYLLPEIRGNLVYYTRYKKGSRIKNRSMLEIYDFGKFKDYQVITLGDYFSVDIVRIYDGKITEVYNKYT